MKRPIYMILLTSLSLSLTSCATIVNGPRQAVGISSNPTNATIWVDRRFVGNTPAIVKMTRKQNHLVHLELSGYLPYELSLTSHMSGWVFGNVIFGGIIGIAVDAVTGSMYALTPCQVQAEMQNQHFSCSKKTKGPHLFVVLEAQPSWKKIGNLVEAQ